MTGNLADIRKALKESGISVGDVVGYDDTNPLAAEIVPGFTPAWHVIETLPAHERIAGAHLTSRRFGIYVPETERQEIRHGKKTKVTRPMFPGYIFVFVWDIDSHVRRIVSCPGVWRIMYIDQRPAIISDTLIREIQIVENRERPLTLYTEGFAKPKKRWRRKPRMHEEAILENDIVSVRTWSAFTDGLAAVDDAGRNQLLRKALGLPL